jgi:hypothetical protein
MNDTVVLVRTHYIDDQVRDFIGDLSRTTPHPVYALVDESRGAIDFGDLPKISIGPGLPAVLGLYDGAEKLYWRCGDYGLYAARQALPNARRYWMIEPDVRLHQVAPGAFFDRFADDPSDFLAAHLRPAEDSWDWGKTMADGGPVWRCLYPLVRLAGPALDHLLGVRRAAGAPFVAEGRDSRFWPNDEVFTATTLKRAGFACKDLNHSAPVYDPDSFGYWWPISDRQLADQGREGFAYHPVLNGDRYFQKLFHLACRLHDFAGLEGAIEALTGSEWDAEQAANYRRAVDLAKSHLAA